MQTKIKNIFKKSIDVVLTVLLLFIIAYQVTGEEWHEWLGIGMTALLIVHHILNIKWYGALFQGKYRTYRITLTALNTLLFISIATTAISGIPMSIYAVPSMYEKINLMLARKMHLAMSYWSFILMGIHIDFHIKAMTAKLANKVKIIFTIISAVISSIGLWLFLKNGIPNYVFFKTHFAFLDCQLPLFTNYCYIILLVIFQQIFLQKSGILPRPKRSGILKQFDELKCANDGFILINGGSFRMGRIFH